MKSQKSQKRINEVQKKTKQNRKNCVLFSASVLHAEKH